MGYLTYELVAHPHNLQTTPFSPSNKDLLNRTVYPLNVELWITNANSDKET